MIDLEFHKKKININMKIKELLLGLREDGNLSGNLGVGDTTELIDGDVVTEPENPPINYNSPTGFFGSYNQVVPKSS
jgi:hypothetical protein